MNVLLLLGLLMAITHEGAVPGLVATQATGTSVALVIPSGVVADDILVIDCTTIDTNGMTCTDNDTGGNAWTSKQLTTGSGTRCQQLFWKRATSGTASKTVTVGGGTVNTSALLNVYRGCLASGDPIEALVAEANASGDNGQAQITTLTAGAMVCCAASISDDRRYTANSADCTDPATLTTRNDVINATGATDTAIFHASAVKASAGGTGAFSWSWAANFAGTSMAYALAPAAGGGGSPQTLTATAPLLTVSAPAATRNASTRLTAGAPVVSVTAPTAARSATRTLTAGAPAVTFTAPTATLPNGGQTLAAAAPVVTVTAPTATRLAVTPLAATVPVVTISAPTASRLAAKTLSATAPTLTITAPMATLPSGIVFIDQNQYLLASLRDYYGVNGSDLVTLLARYVADNPDDLPERTQTFKTYVRGQ